MARPTKLDAATTEKLVQAIRVGATYQLACKYAGITYQTFLNWMKRGEDQQSGAWRDFYDAMTHAEGQAAITWLAVIEKAAAKDYRAAAWKLERRYPHEYGRTVQETEHSGDITIRFVDADD